MMISNHDIDVSWKRYDIPTSGLLGSVFFCRPHCEALYFSFVQGIPALSDDYKVD